MIMRQNYTCSLSGIEYERLRDTDIYLLKKSLLSLLCSLLQGQGYNGDPNSHGPYSLRAYRIEAGIHIVLWEPKGETAQLP